VREVWGGETTFRRQRSLSTNFSISVCSEKHAEKEGGDVYPTAGRKGYDFHFVTYLKDGILRFELERTEGGGKGGGGGGRGETGSLNCSTSMMSSDRKEHVNEEGLSCSGGKKIFRCQI